MRRIFFLFVLAFVFSCSSQVTFDSVDGEGSAGKNKLSKHMLLQQKKAGSKNKKLKNNIRSRIVHDMIPVSHTLEKVEKKPVWVSHLEEKTEVNTINKKFRKTSIIGTDLVAEKSKEVSKEPEEKKEPEEEKEPEEKKLNSSIKPKVDIIFNIDSSASMRDKLNRVKFDFRDFLYNLSNLDWRMMFDNADQEDHWYSLFQLGFDSKRFLPLEYNGMILTHKYLTQNSSSKKDIFLDTIGLHDNTRVLPVQDTKCGYPPFCHGGNEQPLRALRNSFKNDSSYFRDQADMAVVIFSDSDEGEKSNDNVQVKATQVIEAFKQRFGKDKKLIIYGIIASPKDVVCKNYRSIGFSQNGEGVFGYELNNAVTLTGGKVYSLCETDYSVLSKQISVDFRNK